MPTRSFTRQNQWKSGGSKPTLIKTSNWLKITTSPYRTAKVKTNSCSCKELSVCQMTACSWLVVLLIHSVRWRRERRLSWWGIKKLDKGRWRTSWTCGNREQRSELRCILTFRRSLWLVDRWMRMKRPNIANDILLSRTYGRDFRNSRKPNSLYLFVSSIMEVPCIALVGSWNRDRTSSSQPLRLRDFRKDRTRGKYWTSDYHRHNLTQVASKYQITKFYYLVVSTKDPSHQSWPTPATTPKKKEL